MTNLNTNNAANTISNTDILTALFPLVAGEVRRAESLFSIGADKLKAVVKAIQAIHAKTTSGVSFESFSAQIQEMVESIVAYYNRTGSFKSSEQKLAA